MPGRQRGAFGLALLLNTLSILSRGLGIASAVPTACFAQPIAAATKVFRWE